MAQSNSPPVPAHLWICGYCGGPTIISKDPAQCPIDGHPRDFNIGCCKNPGEPCPSGLFPGHPQHEHHYTDHRRGHSISFSIASPVSFNQTSKYNDLWDCTECDMTDNPDWHDHCPNCGSPRPSSDEAMEWGFLTCAAGSVAPGSWVCGECQCANGPNDVACASCYTPKPEGG